MFLLDTNVVSELRKIRSGRADPKVVAWVRNVDPNLTYVSAITVHEIEIGALIMERRDPNQGITFRGWLENDVLPAFRGRVLPVDTLIARISASFHVPDPAPFHDAMIGATAKAHDFTLVTRNTADFRRCGIPLLNPWQPD
jgi:toxin FitB